MKFWKKIFLYSVILFLILFNGAGVIIIERIHNDNLDNALKFAVDKYLNIESIIYINTDHYNDSNIKNWLDIVINGYSVNNHEEYNIELYSQNNGLIMSKINDKIQGDRREVLDAKSDEKQFLIRNIDDEKYVFISSIINLGNKNYKLIVSKNIQNIYSERIENYKFFFFIDLMMFLVLAIGMYIISKTLTAPLVNLSDTSKDIAKGDYSKRAIEGVSDDEIGVLERNFNIMIDVIEDNIKELKYLNESKQRFIDSLNHEIKTPITSIIGYSDLLLKGKVNEDIRIKALTYINTEAKRLESINSTLLKLTLIREEKISLEKTNLSDIINSVYNTMIFNIENKHMKVNINVKDVNLFVDKQLIRVLLTNILDNSIKASNEGSLINIEGYYEMKESNYTLKIKDFGIGISEDDLDKILEPFYMVDKSRTRKNNGIGLGLSICSEICKVHNIKIEINSELNIGTQVTLIFGEESVSDER